MEGLTTNSLTKTYRPSISQNTVAYFFGLIIFAIAIAVSAKNLMTGIVAILGFFILYFGLLIVLLKFTRIVVSSSGELSYKNFFTKKNLNVKKIAQIRRGGMLKVLKNTFPAMHIHYIDESNKQEIAVINAASFSDETVVQFLKNLLAINPNIEVDSSYQKLLKQK